MTANISDVTDDLEQLIRSGTNVEAEQLADVSVPLSRL
jgi:hypothetical protein